MGPACATLLDAASTGAGLLDDVDIALVGEAVAAWDGSLPPLAWDELPDRDRRPGARLAVLAAIAPYRITDEDVTAWLKPPFTDHRTPPRVPRTSGRGGIGLLRSWAEEADPPAGRIGVHPSWW
ncbi:hypothetical protein [Streptomyces sp. NPDC058297]|uniref:hypothetical protein n=1 Tax=Streptomyces sp. NPDC058297 TaxID=3346433 RepID=UPI0036ED7CAB